MGVERLDNVAPVVYSTKSRQCRDDSELMDSSIVDPVDSQEIFDYIRDINDPEHPYTLEQLNVVQEELIKVIDEKKRENQKGAYCNDDNCGGDRYVDVSFTPTIPHCSMATLIGLAIYVKLKRSLDPEFKVLVHITPGSHSTEEAINRQLADKERVAAAMENPNLMRTINQCLRPRE